MDPTIPGDAAVDEIRRLTEENRRARDHRLEERLVAARHEAFSAIDRALPTVLPLPIAAKPPDGSKLPEITPGELSPASLRAGLASHGCVLVRGLVDERRAESLVAGIDSALDAFDRGLDGAAVNQTTPWYVPFEPGVGEYRVGGRRSWVRASGSIWTVDSPRMLFEVCELIDDTGVGDLITAHLGERPALSANKCTLRRVRPDTNTNWHQDGAFLGPEIRSLNLWLSLSHCGVDAPSLDIVPRRLDHVLETGTAGALFDWSVGPDLVAEAALGARVTRPEFAPGDAMLFDHLLLHRTGVGPGMRRERYAIETWLFAPSTYPDGQIPVVY